MNFALREAAASDPELSTLMTQREVGRHANITEGMSLMAGRPITPREADALWALTDIAVYRMLVDQRGWSGQDYQEWISDTIAWRTVPSRRFPDSTEWRFVLEPCAAGTRITQTYEVVWSAAWWAWLMARMVPPHRDRSAALAADLRRIGEVAQGA